MSDPRPHGPTQNEPSRGERSQDEPTQATSPLGAALEQVGDRWSLLLVEGLLDGPRRFSDLRAEVAGIAPNILAERLRRLETAGLIHSNPYTHRPLRLEYALTADGRDLAGALRLLADWGAHRATVGEGAGEHEPLRHATCGTPLEARWYCPTCGLAIEDEEAGESGQTRRV